MFCQMSFQIAALLLWCLGVWVRAGGTLAPSFMLNWIGRWSLTEVSGTLPGGEDQGLLSTLEMVLTQTEETKDNMAPSQAYSASG